MESAQCKLISFLLTASYRLTAFAGLLAILITSDAKLSSSIIFTALILFTVSHYVESFMCRYQLRHQEDINQQELRKSGS